MRRWAGALMIVLAVSSCSVGESSATWALDGVDLPDTVEEIAAAYDAMPAEVAGFARTGEPGGEHLVDYGERGPSLFNQPGGHRVVDDEELPPGEYLSFVLDTGEVDVVASDLDGDVVWAEVASQVGDESGEWTEYMLICGHADGEHLLFFTATSEEDLDAVVAAFRDAVEG